MSYPRYERFRDQAGKWRFRLRDRNYHIVLSSSEGYNNKTDCSNAIGICQRNAPFEGFYSRRVTMGQQYYFILTSENGRDIGRSEDYNSIASREAGISNVKRDGTTLLVVDV